MPWLRRLEVRQLFGRPVASIGDDPRWFEMASAAAGIGFGLSVLFDPRGLAHPGYALLDLAVHGIFLGIIMLLAGLGQALAVCRDHQAARIPFAALGASAWSLIGYYLAVASPWSPTAPLILVLSAGNTAAMLVLIRLHRRRSAVP